MGRRQTGWILALAGAGLAFGLGWLVGRGDREGAASTGSAAADAGLRPEDVELRLDAGALTLLPEGGLELEPIEPIGGASASGGSGPQQSP
ncbi:MAG TPA: hypothetical protein ENK57_02795 [Polyangiaceae bacterium]|nr:hypothetical protein [Polyangiaceae bacterium]